MISDVGDLLESLYGRIRQPRPRVYLKEGTYHTRLFRGPSTNGMKKWDGPSRSFFSPPSFHTLSLSLAFTSVRWSASSTQASARRIS